MDAIQRLSDEIQRQSIEVAELKSTVSSLNAKIEILNAQIKSQSMNNNSHANESIGITSKSLTRSADIEPVKKLDSSSQRISANQSHITWLNSLVMGTPAIISYSRINSPSADDYLSPPSLDSGLTHIKTLVYTVSTPLVEQQQSNKPLVPVQQTYVSTTAVNLYRDISERYPSIVLYLSRLNESYQLLNNFKCLTTIAKRLNKRIINSAYSFGQLFYSNTVVSTIDFNGLIAEMTTLVNRVIETYSCLSKTGFVKALLRQSDELEIHFNEIESKFKAFAKKINELIVKEGKDNDVSQHVPILPDDLDSINLYNELGEEGVLRASGHPIALKLLAERLEAQNIEEFQAEIESLAVTILERMHRSHHWISLSPLEISNAETENPNILRASGVLNNDALRQFWEKQIGNIQSVSFNSLANHIEEYIRSEFPYSSAEASPEASKEIIKGIKASLIPINQEFSDTDMLSVYDFNRITRHFNQTSNFLGVLLLIVNPSRKLIPCIPWNLWKPMPTSNSATIVWGNNGCYEACMKSLTISGGWTVVYGPSMSGKSYRYLVAAHDLPQSHPVLWLDFQFCKTTLDFARAIAVQLSFPVQLKKPASDGSVESSHIVWDSDFYVEAVLDMLSTVVRSNLEWIANIKDTSVSIVIDHIQPDYYIQFEPVLKTFNSFRGLPVNVTIITSINNHGLHANVNLPFFIKSLTGTFASEIQISELSLDDSTELARIIDAEDPELLVAVAGRLPGDIVRLLPIPAEHLQRYSLRAETLPCKDFEITNLVRQSLTGGDLEVARVLEDNIITTTQDEKTFFTRDFVWHILRSQLPSDISIEERISVEDKWATNLDYLLAVGLIKDSSSGFYFPVTYRQVNIEASPLNKRRENANRRFNYWRYLKYWIGQSIVLNHMMFSDASLLGCYLFDCSYTHFKMIIDFINVTKVSTDDFAAVNTAIGFSMQLAGHLSSIIDNRLGYLEGISIFQAFIQFSTSTNSDIAPGSIGIIPHPINPAYWKNNDENRLFVLGLTRALAWQHFLAANYETSVVMLESMLDCFSSSDEDLDLAATLDYLASVYVAVGRNEDAIDAYKRCIEMQTKHPGVEYETIALTCRKLGDVLAVQGYGYDAVDVYQKCVECMTAATLPLSLPEKDPLINEVEEVKGIIKTLSARFDKKALEQQLLLETQRNTSPEYAQEQ